MATGTTTTAAGMTATGATTTTAATTTTTMPQTSHGYIVDPTDGTSHIAARAAPASAWATSPTRPLMSEPATTE